MSEIFRRGAHVNPVERERIIKEDRLTECKVTRSPRTDAIKAEEAAEEKIIRRRATRAAGTAKTTA